jgi:U3 small nucleolar RNA-associated protein 10
MDMETVRALGSNGLEQLRLKDENFEAYESLFNPASIQTNRLMLTAQQGKDLNKQLDGFLSLLSPLFQLPAAHKALEWLVRRYHVHIYNVPELLKHFLPFHSTKVFVRLVQLLDIKIDDALWSFLKPFQKSGAVIERETLVRRAITDGNFVHFLCKSVADHRHETRADSSHIANLWSSVMVGVLEAICTDDLIQRVLPALVFTLKSPHSQLRSAAYIVLSAIARKQPLYIDVLEQLVAILVDSLAAPVVPQGLCCLAVLAQSQDIHVFKDTVLFKLIDIPNVSSEVSLISESFSIQPLLLLLGESLLPHALTNEACASKLLALLESCQFHGDSVCAAP